MVSFTSSRTETIIGLTLRTDHLLKKHILSLFPTGRESLIILMMHSSIKTDILISSKTANIGGLTTNHSRLIRPILLFPERSACGGLAAQVVVAEAKNDHKSPPTLTDPLFNYNNLSLNFGALKQEPDVRFPPPTTLSNHDKLKNGGFKDSCCNNSSIFLAIFCIFTIIFK